MQELLNCIQCSGQSAVIYCMECLNRSSTLDGLCKLKHSEAGEVLCPPEVFDNDNSLTLR